MQRRDFLLATAIAAVLAGRGGGALAAPATAGPAQPFDDATVPALARATAAAPYQPPAQDLPASLEALGYDAYRDLRYRGDQALWAGRGLPSTAQFFHRGFLFPQRVEMYEVADGQATAIAFSPDLFDYGRQAPVAADAGFGFAGFRLHVAGGGRADGDELCAFLGASYFRAVAQGLAYGLSARGLALGTGDPGPEEFPLFRAFWLERPRAGSASTVVHALLDSPSVAGAYRLVITADGPRTRIEVEARLYPRVQLRAVGIAPLTSMFAFDASDRVGVDDYRPAVHDSDGLALWTGSGEQVWRALANPAALQVSGLQDRDPRGFGLMQRKRDFEDFLDTEADYERRPSLWVEPRDPWGEGEVHLVEIPTADEFHDNIVAAWRPAQPLAAGQESRWRYVLHWEAMHSWDPTLALVTATRAGAAFEDGVRLFVLDWHGGALDALADGVTPLLELSASAGEVRNAVVQRNPEDGQWRTSFELVPGAATAVELRARLHTGGRALGETWLYRWTS
ncbi:glucan biosynthesis protein [Luteimonas yindakuii]|uniref:Glucans biosynthesis protein D n=1 Tax=Luteimonas yindakuii TaxID=2565782 RepID=A0A4Z1R268_9GAMM|nr:glucan biosynthesis protein [Luteimonas yindakuii]QCO66854.1 glucan biosynthesis protein [Luteimonas yindakuii]TKS53026.1 glucan biosynthesis protein [Luteimonas yindakuii]